MTIDCLMHQTNPIKPTAPHFLKLFRAISRTASATAAASFNTADTVKNVTPNTATR